MSRRRSNSLSDLDPLAIRVEPGRKGVDRSRNLILFSKGAFPDCGHAPSRVHQRCLDGAVAQNIRFELGLPELGARGRRGGVAAAFVPMPEAAMDEDDGAIPGHYQIGPTR